MAARFALDHPDLTEKITLNAAFGLADDEEEISGIIKRRGQAYDDPSWENIKKIFDSLILHEDKRIPDLVALRQRTYQLPGMKEAAEHVLAIFGPTYLKQNLIPAEDWRKIKAPTLVIASLNDRPLYLNTARTVANLIPNAKLLEMSNVGHWPPFEDPEFFNRENLAFLLGK